MLDQSDSRLTGILDRLRGSAGYGGQHPGGSARGAAWPTGGRLNFKVVKRLSSARPCEGGRAGRAAVADPGQQVDKVVRDELVELLGGSAIAWPWPRTHRRSSC